MAQKSFRVSFIVALISHFVSINNLAFAQDTSIPQAKISAGYSSPIVALDTQIVAFINVNVVPMDRERILPKQTVLVQGGRIMAIGPANKIKAPDTALPIDGRDKYLMPGLADMHIHLRYNMNDAHANPAMLQLFVANGVTTVLNLLGLPLHLELRAKVARGEILGPVIYTSGFYVNEPFVKTPEEVERAVIEQKRAGYDVIKMHGELSRQAYHRLIEVAHREGLRVVGHAPRQLGIEALLAERQDVVAHAEEYLYAYFSFNRRPPTAITEIISMADSIAEATAKAGVWVMPTLTVYKNISFQVEDIYKVLKQPEMRYVPPAIAADWQPEHNIYLRPPFRKEDIPNYRGSYWTLERLVAAFRHTGVRLLAGTDTPVSATVPGFSLHDELKNLVATGLTPYEALRSATANAAEFLGASDEFGTVAIGRRADLILVEGDPLQDVTNAARRVGVMIRGRWLPETELRRMLEDSAAVYAHKGKL